MRAIPERLCCEIPSLRVAVTSMQRYKCNIEMVLSGQIKNIVETHFNRSTYNCMQVALANLLFEIIMVRDGVLSLPTWFSCYFIDDVLSSVCV